MIASLGSAEAAFGQTQPGKGVAAGGPTVTALPVEAAVLALPPAVPPPIERRHRAKVTVDLEIKERLGRLADGVEYTLWTYGGSVPGPLIRVRQGDVVEFRLHNPRASRVPHNIDLHAVTGPGAGAGATFTAPGRTSQFTFSAVNAGLFVYQCATAPVPMHVGGGMYGLMLVEPPEGLPKVDHEYYVMQGEFYTRGNAGQAGPHAFDEARAQDERPTHVLFNGAADALVGRNALQSRVGETVRLFFGVGGPNLGSSFRVMGDVVDRVYAQGNLKARQEGLAVAFVPSGGAAILELSFEVPGMYVFADQSLTRAYAKGAMGVIDVRGPERRDLYSGQQLDTAFAKDTSMPSEAVVAPVLPIPPPMTGRLAGDPRMERGQKVYFTACFACHMPNGLGLPPVFPPLAGSDYLKADRERAIRVLIHGLNGPITVNGQTFNSPMPPQELSDAQMADVLTYVMNSWGNDFGTVSVEDVKRIREAQ